MTGDDYGARLPFRVLHSTFMKRQISLDTVTHLSHRLAEATLQRPAMNLKVAHCGERCSVRSMSTLTQDRES